VVMSKEDFDQLRLPYKKAVDEWVDTIRAQEALASSDHSKVASSSGILPFGECEANVSIPAFPGRPRAADSPIIPLCGRLST
jgi:hypothetical protein